MDLGQKVLHLRKLHGLSQAEAAKRCGIDKSVIARLEAGGTTPDGRSRRGIRPGASTLQRIADGFGVPVQYLTTEVAGYMPVFVAGLAPEVLQGLKTRAERVRFVLEHLERMYGAEGSPAALSARTGLRLDDLTLRDGASEELCHGLALASGVPESFFGASGGAIPAHVLASYEDVVYRLMAAGVPPEALEGFLQGWVAGTRSGGGSPSGDRGAGA